MYYGFEEPIEAPKVAIWDMQPMMQYISLLKDRYDKAQEKMDKFAEKYGDFYSPLASDNARWNELTVGGMTNMLNSLEQQGVDPFRSSEGIGAVNRHIRSVNTDELKNIKASAPIYESYLKEAAKLGDKYNPELEGLRSGFVVRDENGELRRISPNEWDSSKYGIFPYHSPIALESLRDLSSDTFKGYAQRQRLRGGADYEYDRDRLGSDAKYYDIFGVTPEDQAKAVSAVKKALDNTIEGQFYRLQAQKEARARIASGEYNPDQFAQLADKIYTRDILEANADQLQEKDEINEFAKMRAHSNEQIRVHAANAATDWDYAQRQYKLEHPEQYNSDGTRKDPSEYQDDDGEGFDLLHHTWKQVLAKALGVDINTLNVRNVKNNGVGANGAEMILNRQAAQIQKHLKNGYLTHQAALQILRGVGQKLDEEDVCKLLTGHGRDPKTGGFTVTSDMINYIYDAQHLVSRMRGTGTTEKNRAHFKNNTNALRNKLNKADDEIIAVPLGDAEIHYSKDGRLHYTALCRITIPTKDSNTSEQIIAPIHIGARSNKITTSTKNFGIDFNVSTRAAGKSRNAGSMKNTPPVDYNMPDRDVLTDKNNTQK